MPDISMCSSTTCPLKSKCYRNPASGTQPSEFRQSWFATMEGWGEDCKYYWPVRGTMDQQLRLTRTTNTKKTEKNYGC